MKYLYIIVLVLISTSCLKSNFEDLPEFEDAKILGVQKVEYRFYDQNDISKVDGQPIVKYVDLPRTTTIDNNVVSIVVTVPPASEAFSDSEREKVTLTNIGVMVSISTAARLTPLEGAPKMGLPGDWSKPNKYLVTAANGATQTWTVEVTQLEK